jgi:hypothetical protein
MRPLLLFAFLMLASCSSPEAPETTRNNSGLIFHKVPPPQDGADHSPAYTGTPTPTPASRPVHPANDFRDSPFGAH